MELEKILTELKRQANPKNIAGMARFGINPNQTLGVSIPVLRGMAKEIGRNHELALELWKTGIHEARILAGFIDDAKMVTEKQIVKYSTDERNFVKKAVNWALRQMGCRGRFARTRKSSGTEKSNCE